jgi:hypothetical protein
MVAVLVFYVKIKFPVEIQSSRSSVKIIVLWVVMPCTKLHVVISQKSVILNIQAISLMSVANYKCCYVGTQRTGEQMVPWSSRLLLQSGYSGISYHLALWQLRSHIR